VVEDGKLLYAGDLAYGGEMRSADVYFLEAIEAVRQNRRKYARSRPPRMAESVPVGFCSIGE
ncbi:MAG TPA: hypothetical protein VHW24_00235, partial [Bryobacteraceae bacterium]|nr:hypothetical protein [Bryobacteraceae bacterium]